MNFNRGYVTNARVLVAEGVEMRSAKTVVGYASRLSVRPGEDIAFHASTYAPGAVDLQMVRLFGCDDPSRGGRFREENILSPLNRTLNIPHQSIFTGSAVRVPPCKVWSAGGELHFGLFVWPGTIDPEKQVLLELASASTRISLSLDKGRICLSAGGSGLRAYTPLVSRHWYLIVASIGGEGGALAIQQHRAGLSPFHRMEPSREFHGSLKTPLDLSEDFSCTMAASLDAGGQPSAPFTGKLEAPTVFGARPSSKALRQWLDGAEVTELGVPLIASWDFASDIPTDRVPDVGPHGRHGKLLNLPTRGVTGRRWNGTIHDWTVDTSHHAAIHFHGSDVVDAGWVPTVRFVVPEATASGLYALRMRQGGSEHYMPFYVLPPKGRSGGQIAFLAPTASYLAYANITIHTHYPDFFPQLEFDDAGDEFVLAHPEVGGGLYDVHPDGSGVHFSSLYRPIANFSAKTSNWAFSADGDIIEWLEQAGNAYDIITDDALHREGEQLLKHYRVIVTGTHPEYWSTAMMEALKAWLAAGGRLMYMGGNGFYWRIAFSPDGRDIIEVRRAEDGTRAWLSEPGEYVHSFTGELGGMWRRLGTPPQALTGVGFAAQGFGGSSHYRLTDQAGNPRVAFALEGVEGPTFGDYGSHGGGAAGEELDRADPQLGTPPHAIVIASSEGHNALMLRAKEELQQTMPGGIPDPCIRADMVFFEGPKGGAVWTTGSISWAGSLGHRDYDNDVARITTNVLRRFVDPTPFVPPGSVKE